MTEKITDTDLKRKKKKKNDRIKLFNKHQYYFIKHVVPTNKNH